MAYTLRKMQSFTQTDKEDWTPPFKKW